MVFGKSTGPPSNYQSPKFPGLTSEAILGPPPEGTLSTAPVLWHSEDIILYTVLWTEIIFGIVFGGAGFYALLMFYRTRLGIILFIGITTIGFTMGAISGSVVGAVIASIYASGVLPCPTWVPLTWATVQLAGSILFSYSQVVFVTICCKILLIGSDIK